MTNVEKSRAADRRKVVRRYPENGLRPEQRKFEDTFSAFDAVRAEFEFRT